MESGRERLRGWVERSRLTYRAAAQLLGFHYTFLSQLLNNDRSPSLATAVRIEKVTGIPVEAWMPTEDDAQASSSTASASKPSSDKA